MARECWGQPVLDLGSFLPGKSRRRHQHSSALQRLEGHMPAADKPRYPVSSAQLSPASHWELPSPLNAQILFVREALRYIFLSHFFLADPTLQKHGGAEIPAALNCPPAPEGSEAQ